MDDPKTVKSLRTQEEFDELVKFYSDFYKTNDGTVKAALFDIMIIEKLSNDKVLAGILKDIANNVDRIATVLEKRQVEQSLN